MCSGHCLIDFPHLPSVFACRNHSMNLGRRLVGTISRSRVYFVRYYGTRPLGTSAISFDENGTVVWNRLEVFWKLSIHEYGSGTL